MRSAEDASRSTRPYAQAREAYRCARTLDALTHLRDQDSADSILLRARALLRIGDPSAALNELQIIDPLELATLQQAEFYNIRSICETQTYDFAAAYESLAHAFVYSVHSRSAAAECEHYFAKSVLCFAKNELAEADRWCNSGLSVTTTHGFEDAYAMPIEHSRARIIQTCGVIADAREDYAMRRSLTRRALKEISKSPICDKWITASLIMTLSFVVRDFGGNEDERIVEAFVSKSANWSDELACLKFFCHRSLGWVSAMRGDYLGALREYRFAIKVAPTPAHAVWAAADKSFLSREIGEGIAAREELDNAYETAMQINWERSSGEERLALIFLARELAYYDVSLGRTIFDRYCKIQTKILPILSNARD